MATVIIANAWRSARLVLPSPSSMTRPAAAVVAYRANRGYWHFVAGGGRPFHVSVDMGESNGDAENDTRDMTSTKAPIRRDDIIELYDGVISDLYERGRVGGGGEGAGGRNSTLEELSLNGGGPTGVFVKGTADEVVLSPSSDDDDGTSYREETDELDLAPIEDAICKSHYIEQAVVVRGADRPYNVALIVPDWVAVRLELGMPAEYISEEELAKSDGVKELILSEIERNCYKINKSRIPASFAFVTPFQPDRRDVVIESNGGVISDLYERGHHEEEDEIRWRRFPLDGGPRIIKARDEVIPPTHDDREDESYREETDDLDPTPIEDAICESHYIEQAVVVRGADRPYNVALIVPDWVAVRLELGMPAEYISEEEMAKSDGVRELIQSEIERNCYKIDKSRIPASFAIVAPFTAKNDTTAP